MEMINVMDVNFVLIIVGAALAFGWGFFLLLQSRGRQGFHGNEQHKIRRANDDADGA